jgi:hypothetical protein
MMSDPKVEETQPSAAIPSAAIDDELEASADLRRRKFVVAMLATAGLATLPGLGGKLITNAVAASPQLTRETLNGIAVFFAPGPDPFSLQQGESTVEPGAIETGAGEGLLQALNFANPFAPDLADTVAGIFNSTALAVQPNVTGPFQSQFANLTFQQKGVVFAALEGNAATAGLAGVLPLVVSFLTFAETAVFDPATRTIRDRPIGWDLCNYTGVSDGRDEFRGYFRNRRKADA